MAEIGRVRSLDLDRGEVRVVLEIPHCLGCGDGRCRHAAVRSLRAAINPAVPVAVGDRVVVVAPEGALRRVLVRLLVLPTLIGAIAWLIGGPAIGAIGGGLVFFGVVVRGGRGDDLLRVERRLSAIDAALIRAGAPDPGDTRTGARTNR